MGLEGVAGPEFDAATDRVSERINVNTEATKPNRMNEMMVEALERRGHGHERIARNASLDDDPSYCGYCNAGCQQGCKQSTLKTYLVDAAAAGRRASSSTARSSGCWPTTAARRGSWRR